MSCISERCYEVQWDYMQLSEMKLSSMRGLVPLSWCLVSQVIAKNAKKQIFVETLVGMLSCPESGVWLLSARIYLRAHLWHTLCTCITGSLLRSETRPTCSYNSQLFITHNASECMNTASFILYKIFKYTVWKSAVYMLFPLNSKLFVHLFEHALCTFLYTF